MTASAMLRDRLRTFGKDVVDGFFEVSHNGFALVGLIFAFGLLVLATRPDLRDVGEIRLMGWLQQRQSDLRGIPVDAVAVERATATDPKQLPERQAAVAFWISKKYRVAPEPVGALVAEAYELGTRVRLDPTLILAVMAIESGFNPFAQSHMGAQGLMQVMTRVHSEKFEGFGGNYAAFDPRSNLRVGVKILKECIARAGSIEGGLKQYVGATTPDDGGYAAKVIAEHSRLRQVADNPQQPPPALPPATPVVPVVKSPADEPVPLAVTASPDPAKPVKPAAADKLASADGS